MEWVVMIISVVASAVFCVFWSMKGQNILNRHKEMKKRKANEEADEISIAGQWTSVFIEANKICNEKIEVTQTGRIITAKISMGKKKYNFNGIFKNHILTGEYKSSNKHNDERGNVSLNFVSEHVLVGHCIFIYKSKEIYNSSYVWIKDEYMDISKGTYPFCGSCVGNSNCCCASDKIDMPILMQYEVDAIALKTQQPQDKFCEKNLDIFTR